MKGNHKAGWARRMFRAIHREKLENQGRTTLKGGILRNLTNALSRGSSTLGKRYM